MNDLVSIIVPVYNREKSIERCVESLLGQTYPDVEIVLVDDGSTDGSVVLVDKLQESDNRVVAFHTSNHGVSAARNMGLQNAHGKYLVFVDSDDYVDVDYIALLMSEVQENRFVWQDFWVEYQCNNYLVDNKDIAPPINVYKRGV